MNIQTLSPSPSPAAAASASVFFSEFSFDPEPVPCTSRSVIFPSHQDTATTKEEEPESEQYDREALAAFVDRCIGEAVRLLERKDRQRAAAEEANANDPEPAVVDCEGTVVPRRASTTLSQIDSEKCLSLRKRSSSSDPEPLFEEAEPVPLQLQTPPSPSPLPPFEEPDSPPQSHRPCLMGLFDKIKRSSLKKKAARQQAANEELQKPRLQTNQSNRMCSDSDDNDEYDDEAPYLRIVDNGTGPRPRSSSLKGATLGLPPGTVLGLEKRRVSFSEEVLVKGLEDPPNYAPKFVANVMDEDGTEKQVAPPGEEESFHTERERVPVIKFNGDIQFIEPPPPRLSYSTDEESTTTSNLGMANDRDMTKL